MKRRRVNTKDQKFTLAAEVLMYFFAFVDLMPLPFENKTHYTRRQLKGSSNYYSYYRVMKKLEAKGWLKIFKDKDGHKNLYALTGQGKLEALFIKAQLPSVNKWDGKWRMVIFDIPEDARYERNKLRSLLRLNGFKLLQKSVFVNPYPLNREAIIYLQQTGLDKFIRVFRMDEVDNEKDLKKMFSL
jgi:CRISPR-associated endonuclease Cas2